MHGNDAESVCSLATHITYVHTNNTFPPLEHEPVSKEYLRSVASLQRGEAHRCSNYMAKAKQYSPHISPEMQSYIAEVYVQMREDAEKVRCRCAAPFASRQQGHGKHDVRLGPHAAGRAPPLHGAGAGS